MSFCKGGVNSFIGLPLPYREDQARAFRQTLIDPLSPLSPPPFSVNGFDHIGESDKTLLGLAVPPESAAGKFAGEKRDGEIDLMSCTESLGLESSDEMISSLDQLNEPSSSSSSPCSSSSRVDKRRERRWSEKATFPPPLTSLSENGRRNFMLKPVRKDGRLEIVGVMIQRPEILRASRQNGRLRLHLVQTGFDGGGSRGCDEEEVQAEAEEADDLEEERENEEAEEERSEWKVITAAGLRRCYYHNKHELHVWGPQQQRFVTTM